VHTSLSVTKTAEVLANEGRRLVECDRLGVLVRRGRRWRLLAASGVDRIDRQSGSARRLEELAAAYAGQSEPLWIDQAPGELPPQIQQPLDAYLDEAHPRVLGLVPLKIAGGDRNSPACVLGLLAVEQFAGQQAPTLRRRADLVAAHGAIALSNALTHESLPLGGLGRLLARSRLLLRARNLPKTLFATLLVAAAAAALVFVPADFEIQVRGELQPTVRREVFARTDGVVRGVRVEHGQSVEEGQVVALLARPELDLKAQEVLGQLDTVDKRLAALEVSRLDGAVAGDDPRQQQWAAEEQELRETRRSLEEQRKILAAERRELEVRSPLAGQVVTWNLQQLLHARPVERGQSLLTVAQLDGPWTLELHVPDERMGHLLSAQETLGRELPVEYRLATEPGVVHRGQIGEVALAVDDAAAEEAIVRVKVPIDRRSLTQPRPGATVEARVFCGRRSLGYVWLHDLVDAIRGWFW
jgi:multidrug efflux pump subunit AcrA (membrane-fusion protein)